MKYPPDKKPARFTQLETQTPPEGHDDHLIEEQAKNKLKKPASGHGQSEHLFDPDYPDHKT
ncbi:MAG: hypothetical protein SVR94_17050 [Pseudomonadota bacterium]|nr:hypothetical protein [Pseudomonadota bacterium]